MVAEEVTPYIEKMLEKHPWRGESVPGIQPTCEGELEFDGGEKWLCVKCGRISSLQHHFHTVPPKVVRMRQQKLQLHAAR